jgi:hypothetical protein
MDKYFKIKDWEDQYFDKLLVYIYKKFNTDNIKKIIKDETSKLQFITSKQLDIVLKAYGDMSIFQSKLDLQVFKNKIFCQLVFPYNIKETNITKHITKQLKITPTPKMIDEIFNILVFVEVMKIHKDKKYRIILERNYN